MTYHFVPAGSTWPSRGGTGVYVKYGTTGSNSLRLKQLGPSYLWVKAPDRELVIVNDSNRVNNFRPLSCNFDEYVSLSEFYGDSAVDTGVKFFMVNYVEALEKSGASAYSRRSGSPGAMKIISDSGGFQIANGRIDYLDPEIIAKWYSDNVDLGMVLDVPPRGAPDDVQEKLAYMQERNTEAMMRVKAPHLELINIFHGNSLDQKRRFREVVERPDITRLAIGGSYYDTILNSMDSLVGTMLEGQKYEHYHVLGVSNILQVILLMRLASKGIAPLITSDSSTAVQEALMQEYFVHTSLADTPRYMALGVRKLPPSLTTLPCQCPVCSVIKYQDIFNVCRGSVMSSVLTHHNMYAFVEYINCMYPIVAEYPLRELKMLLKQQLHSRRNSVETFRGLEFIDEVAASGLQAARRKYRMYLGSLFSSQSTTGLFGGASEVSADSNADRLRMVIGKYESMSEKHGSKKKVKKAKPGELNAVEVKIKEKGRVSQRKKRLVERIVKRTSKPKQGEKACL